MEKENSQISHLSSRVASVETDIRNIGNSVDKLAVAVDSLGDKVGRASKTDWGVLGTWSAVIIAIITSIGYLSTEPLKEAVIETRRDLKRHMTIGSHPASVERSRALKSSYEENKERLRLQDEYLQREMRDLDRAITTELSAKIESLDRVLQREIRLLNQTQNERMRAVERHVFKESPAQQAPVPRNN